MRVVSNRTLGWLLALVSCTPATPAPEQPPPHPSVKSPSSVRADASTETTHGSARSAPTFRDDVTFLKDYGNVIVLSDPEGGKVALSALYQGRVMTSAVGDAARSLGWIHREFIAAKKTGTPFDNYGGEDRFWLGPEGGQYGLYFPPGKDFSFDLWQTPHALQEGAWDVGDERADRVVFTKEMKVTNWSNAELDVGVERAARLVARAEAEKILGLGGTPKSVRFVGYETKNTIKNLGKVPWRRETGLVSVWILAMFAPANDARVIVPFERGANLGPIVNDAYFGKVPADRLAVHEDRGVLSFVCDGKQRGKIGVSKVRAKSVLGSFSRAAKLLTIVHYDGPKRSAPYVNSMWEKQKDPYGGDVVNSYNDGSPGPGKAPLGGFYEIETSSPGAELAPNQTLTHTHRTFHFVGEPQDLDEIAKHVLGVSLDEVSR